MANKIESPDGLELRGTPKISARLNKKAVMIVLAAMSGVLLFIISNVSKEKKDVTANPEPKKPEHFEAATGSAKAITADVPDQPLLLPAEPPKLPREGAPGPRGGGGGGGDVPALPDSGAGGGGEGVAPAIPERVALAFDSDTEIVKFAERNLANQESLGPVAGGSAGGGGEAGQLPPSQEDAAANRERESDPNRQSQKESFLERAGRPKGPGFQVVQLNPPLNEFEVKTGTVIPGVMITHVNSDLPGEIVGQVSQNVFDSKTGRYLLIPQGSKLFGRYQSSVSFGQSRLLVVWNRIIFPNATTMDLSGMAGHDKEGTAGMVDRVNHHYARTFGFALLTSIFSAAFQLSQPQDNLANEGVLSNRQVVGAAVGQQMSQLGIEIARRNLSVQPTIEIRKGTKFTVMVNKDLVFPGVYEP